MTTREFVILLIIALLTAASGIWAWTQGDLNNATLCMGLIFMTACTYIAIKGARTGI